MSITTTTISNRSKSDQRRVIINIPIPDTGTMNYCPEIAYEEVVEELNVQLRSMLPQEMYNLLLVKMLKARGETK